MFLDKILDRLAKEELEIAKLEFLKNYLLRTREEIDIEKQEGTRILNLKIIVLGAFFALIPTLREMAIAGLVFLPYAFFALDLMQVSRLDYIIHRWEHLAEEVVPRIRAIVKDDKMVFFEELVVMRKNKGEYHEMEATIRTILIVPTMAASVVSAAVLLLHLGVEREWAYVSSIAWLVLLVVVATINRFMYRRIYLIIICIVALIAWMVVVFMCKLTVFHF